MNQNDKVPNNAPPEAAAPEAARKAAPSEPEVMMPAETAPSLWDMLRPQWEMLWAQRRQWHRMAWAGIKDYFSLHDQEDKLDGLKDFVTDADHYILHQKPLRGHLIVRIGLLGVLLFIVWAAITHVDELVKGDGKVVPSSQLQVLQSLDGGIVQEILVKEGDAVTTGQAMVKIDSTRFMSSFRENMAQNIALAARAERLNALLENRPFRKPAQLPPEADPVFEQEHRYYDNARNELSAQISIAQQQLSQRQQERGEAIARRDQSKQMMDSATRELGMTKPLLGTGAVSEVELLRLERDISRFRGEMSQAIAQIGRLEAAMSEASRKIQQVELEFRNNMRKDLSDTMAKLNSLSEGSVGLQDKVDQSIIKAPMNGYVKRLFVNTVGGVVTPGKDIVEVVPSEDSLLLEAKVTPRDIAFLRVGQNALIKFTAYDFAIYGGMDAKLESIGADSITDEKGNTYFVVKLRTLKAKLRDHLPIIPGMQAEVDIQTGSKSILTYLMKPILRAKQAALTER